MNIKLIYFRLGGWSFGQRNPRALGKDKTEEALDNFDGIYESMDSASTTLKINWTKALENEELYSENDDFKPDDASLQNVTKTLISKGATENLTKVS